MPVVSSTPYLPYPPLSPSLPPSLPLPVDSCIHGDRVQANRPGLVPGGILLADRATLHLTSTSERLVDGTLWWDNVWGFDMSTRGRAVMGEAIIQCVSNHSLPPLPSPLSLPPSLPPSLSPSLPLPVDSCIHGDRVQARCAQSSSLRHPGLAIIPIIVLAIQHYEAFFATTV